MGFERKRTGEAYRRRATWIVSRREWLAPCCFRAGDGEVGWEGTSPLVARGAGFGAWCAIAMYVAYRPGVS